MLVFGGAGSLLVAVFYVPAAGALERRGQSLSAELFPVNEANEASAILSLAEDRNKLEQLLGVGHGVFADLQISPATRHTSWFERKPMCQERSGHLAMKPRTTR